MIVCVHGLGGAVVDFQPLVERMVGEGFAVWAPNLRGQGHDPSPMRRGGHLDLPGLANDLAAFATEAVASHPGAPLFWCGESLGALLVGWLAAKGQSCGARGAVFSAPVVELRKPTPWFVRQAVRSLAAVWPGGRFRPSWFVSGKTEPLRVTREEGHSAKVREAPHYIPAFSFRFLSRLGELMDDSLGIASHITLPSLVLSAGQDVYIEMRQTRSWFDAIASEDKTLREYPEAFHLLWNDWDRDAVLDDIAAWIADRAD